MPFLILLNILILSEFDEIYDYITMKFGFRNYVCEMGRNRNGGGGNRTPLRIWENMKGKRKLKKKVFLKKIFEFKFMYPKLKSVNE